jgi:PAS domain S-box-containing protein
MLLKSSKQTTTSKTLKKRVPATFLMLNPNPIIQIDFRGKILFANPSAQKAFPNLEGKGLAHPIFSDWKRILQAFKDKSKTYFTREIQVSDDWFIEQIFLIPNSKRVRIYFTDITELKKTQQELEKEKNLLQTVMDGAKNCHLVYLDNNFNFIRVNKTYAKTCGYTPEQMIGKNHFDLYPHGENEVIFKKVRDTLIPAEVKDKPFVFPDQPKRGETYWDWTLQPVSDNDGKVEGLVFSLVETTERKKIQTILEGYASQMEKLAAQRAKQLTKAERLIAIGQTAGMVGHDIRNPLQAIAGELYLAKDELLSVTDNEAKKNLQECLVNIEESLYYIDKIVADLQDYTKPLIPNLQKINIEKAIEEALLIVFIPSNLQVIITIQENFPILIVDFSMLKRALINLIQNAVQAMPKGGTLEISAKHQDSQAIISIKDTGEGIPQKIKDRLFTPLFTTKSKGQGFGLAVVKRLTEAQGGKISFETQKGKGTTFTIQLPLTVKPK